MKKTLAIALALLMALTLLSACKPPVEIRFGPDVPDVAGNDEPAITDAPEIEHLKTIADVYELIANGDAESRQSSTYECRHTCVFIMNDTIYRVSAPMSEETEAAIFAVDYADEDWEEQEKKLLAPLEIDTYQNLTTAIPSQKVLEQYVGMTGEELLDDGWTCSGYYLDEMQFYMDKGLFNYAVTFDGQLEMKDDFDEEEAIKPLKVKSVAYMDLGNATELVME